ncbi:hypothetical protein EI534_07270 [Pseudomonas frederiksbergensis]|nr:hypothetical protein [Pseudomonas frederiksbergensis]
MRVILINVGAVNQVLYASDAQKGLTGKAEEEEKPNRGHKKPRSFDQGLCYRLETDTGFTSGLLRSSKAFSGP